MTSKLTPQMTQERVAQKRATKAKAVVAKNTKALERLAVEYVSTDLIYPNEWNPNVQSDNDFELLLASMRDDGFTQPIIVTMEGKIVDGEHRWRAARQLGLAEIPVVRVDMSDVQQRISTIRHNEARGSHDMDLEAAVLRDLEKLGALDWAKGALFLSDSELDKMLTTEDAPARLGKAETYSEAWVPAIIPDHEAAEITSGEKTTKRSYFNDAQHNPVVLGMTSGAIAEERQFITDVQEATSEFSRAMIEENMFRLNVAFSNEQARLVHDALGDQPAERLLWMCRQELAEIAGYEAANG